MKDTPTMARQKGDATVTIHAPHWDEAETVSILATMTHGIKKQIEQSMFRFVDTSSIDPSKPDMADMKLNLKEALASGDDLKLLLFIKSWTLTDAQGNMLPLTQEGIDSLAEEDIAFIDGEIERRNPSNVTEEQRAAFLQMQSNGTQTDIANPSQLPGG